MKKLLYIFILSLLSSCVFAQLGELPERTSMRVYYHFEDANDNSGNAVDLNNSNGVTFDRAKFTNGANYGASGTNKSLWIVSNPMSALTYANATYSFWVKWNDISDLANRYMFSVATRLTSGTGASQVYMRYTISSGTVTVEGNTRLTTTNTKVTGAFSVNTTDWHHILLVKSTTTTLLLYIDGVLVDTDTGTGSDNSPASFNACFTIGNIRATSSDNALQSLCTFDEFIIEERVWSPSEIKKYYTQSLGRYQTMQQN